jgi:hypothetical protein
MSTSLAARSEPLRPLVLAPLSIVMFVTEWPAPTV